MVEGTRKPGADVVPNVALSCRPRHSIIPQARIMQRNRGIMRDEMEFLIVFRILMINFDGTDMYGVEYPRSVQLVGLRAGPIR